MLWSLYACISAPPLEFQLCITDEGNASLTRSAQGGRHCELGSYRGDVDPATVAKLRSFLDASDYQNSGHPPGEVDFPAGSLLLGEGSYGHPPAEYWRVELRSASGAMATLISYLHECEKQLRLSPERVIAAHADWIPTTRPEQLAFALELSNPGAQTVEIPRPARLSSAFMQLSSPGYPQDARMIPVTLHETKALPALSPSPLLRLASGSKIRLPGVAQLPPGFVVSDATLVMELSSNAPGHELGVSGRFMLMLPRPS